MEPSHACYIEATTAQVRKSTLKVSRDDLYQLEKYLKDGEVVSMANSLLAVVAAVKISTQ